MRTHRVLAVLGAMATCLAASAEVEFVVAEKTLLQSPGRVVAVELRSTEVFLADTQIQVSIGSSTAVQGADFELPSSVAFFPAGAADALLRLILLDNPPAQGDRTLVLILTNPPPGVVIGLKNRLSLTLKATTAEAYYGFEKAVYFINESAGTARVRVKRFGDPSLQGSVTCLVNSGTAGSLDAGLGARTVMVSAGEGSAELEVAIRDDATSQGNRYLELSLPAVAGQPQGLIIAARLVIVDNDGVAAQPISIERYQKAGLIDVYSVSFATQPGFRYLVEYADTGVSGPWLELQRIVGDGELHSANDLRPISTAASRFYRYRLEDDFATR